MAGEDPSVVWLDETGPEDSTVEFGDDDGSIFLSIHHVAARCKGSEADELDRGTWNIMNEGAEAGGSDMSGVDGCSVGAGDGDGSGELSGLKKIGEGVGDGKRSAGVEKEGCDDRNIGGISCLVLSSCSCSC